MERELLDLGALFLSCVFSGLGIPLPEDPTLLAAGWAVARGLLPVAPVLGVAAAGVFLRDWIAFTLGRSLGRLASAEARRPALRLPWVSAAIRLSRRLAAAIGAGPVTLVLARLVPGLHVPLFLAAGLGGASWRSFAVVDGVGLALTVPLTVWLGFRYGESAVVAVQAAIRHPLWLGAAALALGIPLWTRLRAARRASAAG